MKGFDIMKMTVLLPDDSYCKTDLGLLLYKNRKIYGFHAQILNVKEPTNFFGHVEYDINIKATPHNSLNYDIRDFNFTTRFKELNRLYLQLSTIHRQLYLKDTFPTFVEAKIFGSASPETINERRRAIETFLNFVLKSEVLCKSRSFQSFIEIVKEEKTSTSTEKNENLPSSTSESTSTKTDLPSHKPEAGDSNSNRKDLADVKNTDPTKA